jgi:hypothetical protein
MNEDISDSNFKPIKASAKAGLPAVAIPPSAVSLRDGSAGNVLPVVATPLPEMLPL